MKTIGIVAEYNPFHAGHRKQFDRIRAEFGRETAIVCAMSGNFVQRGAPAVLDKTLRAKAAVACGADGLMIEVHNNPAKAKCDGAQSLTPDQFDELMGFITKEVEFFGKKMN